MPGFQADIIPNGPQNIERGRIEFDKDTVSEGFCQFVDFVGLVCDDKRQPTDFITIQNLQTTSSETVNAVFAVLGRAIDPEQGLKRLDIINFCDKNELQGWPLEQLVLRSPTLLHLKIDGLQFTTPANRSILLEFAAQAVTSSSCLNTLHIGMTRSSAEDGDKFM